jgi:glycosyltransferase involved in cell wall biosynthesis
MACGLVLVATAVGGALEPIPDGVDGMLVPARDNRALEAAVAGLVESPER